MTPMLPHLLFGLHSKQIFPHDYQALFISTGMNVLSRHISLTMVNLFSATDAIINTDVKYRSIEMLHHLIPLYLENPGTKYLVKSLVPSMYNLLFSPLRSSGFPPSGNVKEVYGADESHK